MESIFEVWEIACGNVQSRDLIMAPCVCQHVQYGCYGLVKEDLNTPTADSESPMNKKESFEG